MKRFALWAAFLLSFQDCFALEYLENDFRDTNNSLHIRGSFTPKSNQLKLNVFENDWDVIPTYKKNNVAFGSIYFDVYYNFDTFKIGIFSEESAEIKLNDGFVEILYAANNDFNTFLHYSTINTKISKTAISGDANYYKTEGLYVQKLFKLSKNNYLSAKIKLHYGKNLEKIAVNGQNTQSRFNAKLDYYYSNKNYISKHNNNNSSSGYGYSIDVEYIYNKEKLYIYAGLFNIESKLYWRGVERMEYSFDSKTTYRGSDGYNHRRPFGIGKYSGDVNYVQSLPMFYKGSLDYQLNNNFSIGDNLDGYQSVYFNEVYLTARLYNSRYKVGYMYEAKTFIFAAYFNHFKVEISNNFSFSQNVMQAKLHLWF